jgi:hypothetical protein
MLRTRTVVGVGATDTGAVSGGSASVGVGADAVAGMFALAKVGGGAFEMGALFSAQASKSTRM